MNDLLFLILVPGAALGYWALLGGLFHLLDWIHPNKYTQWCRKNLVDASFDIREFWRKQE